MARHVGEECTIARAYICLLTCFVFLQLTSLDELCSIHDLSLIKIKKSGHAQSTTFKKENKFHNKRITGIYASGREKKGNMRAANDAKLGFKLRKRAAIFGFRSQFLNEVTL